LKIFRQDGQALVEMAIILPLLLLLLLGTIEMGRIFHSYIVVTQASREGARVAAVGQSDAEINTVVAENTSSLGGTVRVGITPAHADRRVGDTVTVEVQYEIDLVAPMITAFFPDPFPVTGATSMRVE